MEDRYHRQSRKGLVIALLFGIGLLVALLMPVTASAGSWSLGVGISFPPAMVNGYGTAYAPVPAYGPRYGSYYYGSPYGSRYYGPGYSPYYYRDYYAPRYRDYYYSPYGYRDYYFAPPTYYPYYGYRHYRHHRGYDRYWDDGGYRWKDGGHRWQGDGYGGHRYRHRH